LGAKPPKKDTVQRRKNRLKTLLKWREALLKQKGRQSFETGKVGEEGVGSRNLRATTQLHQLNIQRWSIRTSPFKGKRTNQKKNEKKKKSREKSRSFFDATNKSS